MAEVRVCRSISRGQLLDLHPVEGFGIKVPVETASGPGRALRPAKTNFESTLCRASSLAQQAVTAAVWGTGLRLMAKCFFANAFAMGTDFMLCFGSSGTVIGDSAITARRAVPPHDSNRGAAPTVGTTEVSKVR